MGADAPPQSSSTSRRRTVTAVGVILAIAIVYAGLLLTYRLLTPRPHPLSALDLGATGDTVVVITLDALRTVDNRLDVQVDVVPQDSLMDDRLGVVNTDVAVRLYPPNDLVGDLQWVHGSSPAQVKTTLVANGDPDRWPFDSYTTDVISADVLVGSGNARTFLPARVEVAGSLEGWEISSTRSGPSSQSSGVGDDVTITLRRAREPFIFDLGICLVLLSLPIMALYVAGQALLGKKKFVPPFLGWYAAMLFSVVPIRNILPGSPPTGAWVDQALVLWVLIALIVAMVLYIAAWHRHSD